MKRISLLYSLLIILSISATAEKANHTFHNTPVAAALRYLNEQDSGIPINFIYDELDKYRTSASVNTGDTYEAVKKVIGMNPITLVKKIPCYMWKLCNTGASPSRGK